MPTKRSIKNAQMIVPVEIIQNKIYLIRGQKVIFDRDLAELYGVETRHLTRQVRRNIERFPKDFLIQLTDKEKNNLKCQFGTSSWGGIRKLPMALMAVPEQAAPYKRTKIGFIADKGGV